LYFFKKGIIFKNLYINPKDIKGYVKMVEKTDAVDASNPPESVFGVTLKDAEEYGVGLAERKTLGFVNKPYRKVEEETLWDFMSTDLSEQDEFEISETIKSLEGVFS
jgi:hypothetical protein